MQIWDLTTELLNGDAIRRDAWKRDDQYIFLHTSALTSTPDVVCIYTAGVVGTFGTSRDDFLADDWELVP